MVWWIIATILFLFILWLLISPLSVEIDTRIPEAKFRWTSIGGATIWYNGEWLLDFWVFFYHKTIHFSEINGKPHKKRLPQKKSKKNVRFNRMLKKIIAVAKTFRVKEWQLAIDTGNYIYNGKLYPLNFLPHLSQHVRINFTDENYLVLRISNRPWKILYAFLR